MAGVALVVIGAIQMLLAVVAPQLLVSYPGSPSTRRRFGLCASFILITVGVVLLASS